MKFPQAIATELRTTTNTVTVVIWSNHTNNNLHICTDAGMIIIGNTVSSVVLQFLPVTTEGQ